MRIKPLRDRILVRRDKEEDTYKGTSIFIPDQSKEKPQAGTVISVGPGLVNLSGTFIEVTLKPGDRILCPKHSGVDLKSLEEGLFIIPESEILAVLEQDYTVV